MKTTLALFVEDIEQIDISTVEKIKGFLSEDYDDFCIMSDNNDIFDAKFPVVLGIYLKFFKGDVVFLEPESYIKRSEDLIANQVFLYADIDKVLSSGLSRKSLKDTKLITCTNNTLNIEAINNVTIQ